MRILRISLITLLLAFFVLPGMSQKKAQINLPTYDYKKYHFGFALGVNQMFFSVNNIEEFDGQDSLYVIESSPEFGFNIGIVSSVNLSRNWDLRFVPTLSFGERNLHYTFFHEDRETVEEIKKVESTHIDFPLDLKFKSNRVNNFRAYLLGGLKYSMDLASQAKKEEQDEDLKIKLKKNDILFNFGVGFDFFTSYFKFGIELKMSYGMNDLLVREGNVYTDNISKLSSKVFQLSFTFE